MTDIGSSIVKPTLIVSKKRVSKNIEMMKQKADDNNATLRPHFKTHQSVAVGELFKKSGIQQITVSSIDMAIYFADHGWDDITIAFPVNIRQISDIQNLAKRIDLNLLVESTTTLQYLEDHLDDPVMLWINVDVGYRRSGIDASEMQVIEDLALKIDQSKHQFIGLLTHAGHSYTDDRKKKRQILDASKKQLTSLKTTLQNRGIDEVKVSYGDTPTCSMFDDFVEFDELRPGNFAYYDLMQLSYNSCTVDQIAVLVACPVVAIHPDEDKIIIHGGGVHFSKDVLRDSGQTIYGYLAGHNDNRWQALDRQNRLSSISQDHGKVIIEDKHLFNQIKIGDLLYFYPVHSCMTADLMQNNTILIDE